MNRTKMALFAAEILAVAALRITYMVRRDRVLPRGSKVHNIRGRPVFRPFKKIWAPAKQPSKTTDIAGWTPPPRRDNIETTPGSPPDV